jgi:hypothetical protein
MRQESTCRIARILGVPVTLSGRTPKSAMSPTARSSVLKLGVIVMRRCGRVLVCIFLLVGGVRAAEYKRATFKGVKNHKLAFEVNGQEVILNPGGKSFKSLDQEGKPLTGFTRNVRVLVPGNVVDVVTGTSRKNEASRDARLTSNGGPTCPGGTTFFGPAGRDTFS